MLSRLNSDVFLSIRSFAVAVFLTATLGCDLMEFPNVRNLYTVPNTHFNFYMVVLPDSAEQPSANQIRRYPNFKRRSMPRSRLAKGGTPLVQIPHKGLRYIVVAPTTDPEPSNVFKPMTIFFMTGDTLLPPFSAPHTVQNVDDFFLTPDSAYTLYWTHDYKDNTTVFSTDVQTGKKGEWKDNDYRNSYINPEDIIFSTNSKRVPTLHRDNNGKLVFIEGTPLLTDIIVRSDEPYILIGEINVFPEVGLGFKELRYLNSSAVEIARYAYSESNGTFVYTISPTFKNDATVFLQGFMAVDSIDSSSASSNRFAVEDYIILRSTYEYSIASKSSIFNFDYSNGWAMLSNSTFSMEYITRDDTTVTRTYSLWGQNVFKDLVVDPDEPDYDATKADYFR